MIDLVYPYDIAPLVPAPTADSSAVASEAGECFPVVQPNGLVIGRSSRAYCHSGAKPLHPVVHIHIIDRFSRIYLQKRSMNKDSFPGRYDTSSAGHIQAGDGILESAVRELGEELGISPDHVYVEYAFTDRWGWNGENI